MFAITRLDLSDFRCFDAWSAEFGPGLNLLLGPNGVGKTSILESVHCLFRQKSFRSHLSTEYIRWQSPSTVLVAKLASYKETEDVIGYQRGRNSSLLKLNGEELDDRAEVVHRYPVCAITPASTALVVGGPGERRQFLDQLLFHVEPKFLTSWRRYRKALNQRNALLRSGSLSGIDVWDEQLSLEGEKLDCFRQALVLQIKEPLQQCLEALQQSWSVVFDYRSGWPEGSLASALKNGREQDRRRQSTSFGPHRADWKLSSNGRPVNESLSRGQQRMLGVAMYAAQTKLIASVTGVAPLLLIDDIGAELDDDNANKVIDLAVSFGGQILVTALTADPYLAKHPDAKVFHVEH